jgi:putative transposase
VESTYSRNERLALVERENPELPLTTQCELLSLNRSSLYYRPVPRSPEEIALKHAIDEIYTQYPFYGSRRITAHLDKYYKITVARETVQRCMREMGIAGVGPGPNLSRRNAQHKVYPYLLRNVTAGFPNHIWGIDITYIRLRSGWMYLVAVLDWYSRYVVGWELDQTLEMPFVLTAVRRSLVQAQPMIWNSDQGSHFTSPQYTELLLAAGVQISMDGRGRATDNVFTERLWRTIKYEEVYLKEYNSPRDARRSLAEYLDFTTIGGCIRPLTTKHLPPSTMVIAPATILIKKGVRHLSSGQFSVLTNPSTLLPGAAALDRRYAG